MNRSALVAVLALAAASSTAACGDQGGTHLAPTASALVAEKKAATAQKLTVDPAQSKVTFLMDAPEEKIRGVADKSTSGSIEVDPRDLMKTTGVIQVDIARLELFQTKTGEDGAPGTEEKVELQNKHARAWLEIDEDAPEAERKKNQRVDFSIRKIDKASATDVTKLTGDERKVTLTATGDVLLHQRKSTKTVDLEATFRFEGDKLKSVHVRTVKPFPVGLAEHDVRPREAFGKLAQKTLDVLAPKVAKDAPIELDFVAFAGDVPPPAATPAAVEAAPPGSADPAASASAAAAGSAAPAASAAPAGSAAPSAPPKGKGKSY